MTGNISGSKLPGVDTGFYGLEYEIPGHIFWAAQKLFLCFPYWPTGLKQWKQVQRKYSMFPKSCYNRSVYCLVAH